MVNNVFLMNDKLVSQTDFHNNADSFMHNKLKTSSSTSINNFNLPSISSSFFSLSKPFLLSLINETPTTAPSNSARSKFTFLEPFESHHLSSGGGKLKVNQINKRLQPYSLSKPKPTDQSNADKSDISVISSSSSCVSLSSSSNTSNSSANTTNQQNNAILSRLSNISNSFKSIFVRPKRTRPVDLTSFNNRTNAAATIIETDERNMTGTKFKINLFSTSNENFNSETNKIPQESHQSFDINQKLEKIISRNVMLETYSNKQTNNKLDDVNYKNTNLVISIGASSSSSASTASSSSSSSTPSTISTLTSVSTSTRASDTLSNSTSLVHQRALLMSKNVQNVLSTSVNATNIDLTLSPGGNSQNCKKWTCMICLSKHKIEVKFCSICGSSSTNNNELINNVKSNLSVPNKYKIKLNDTNDYSLLLNNSNTLKPVTSSSNNYLLKTWNCNLCNFTNDSLKIVCMNCRATKQQQNQLNQQKLMNLSHQTLQSKRTRQTNNNTINIKQSIGGKLNRSNEENELLDNLMNKTAKHDDEIDNEVSNKKQKLCTNCKCDNSNNNNDNTNNSNNNLSAQSTPSHLITPMKPEDFNKKYTSSIEKNKEINIPETPKTSSDSSASLSSSKWICLTCLVKNDDSKTSCACCSTLKQSASLVKPLNEIKNLDQTDSKLKATTWNCTTCLVQNDDSKTSCACCSTMRPNSISNETKSKWICSSCLVQNESDKTSCACCLTPKQSNEKNKIEEQKTKFSSLVAAAGSFTNMNDNKVSSNISFGLKSSSSLEATTQPIKFGSSFSLGSKSNNDINETSKATTSISFGASNNIIPAVQPQETKPIEKPFGFTPFGQNNSSTTSLFKSNEQPKADSNTNNQNVTTEPLKFGAFSSGSTENKQSSESVTQTSSLFTTSKPQNSFTFGSQPINNNTNLTTTTAPSTLQISNPFVTSNKTTENKDKPAAATAAPSLFQFGFTSSTATPQTTTNSNTLTNNNNNNNTNTTTSLFSNNNNSQSNFFGNTNNTTNNTTEKKEATPMFGSSFGNSATSNNTPTNSGAFSFGASVKTEPTKPNPTFSFGNTSNTTSQVNLFGNNNPSSSTVSAGPTLFGNSIAPSTKDATGLFGATDNSIKNSSSNFFGSNNSATAPSNTLFGNSANATSSNTFGNSNQVTKSASNTTLFGNSSNNPTTSTNTNVFGQLNQNSNASSFSFGQAQPPQPSSQPAPFMFGAPSQNENKPDTNKSSGFNFNSQATSQPAAFNFTGTPKIESFVTPHKTAAIGTPASPAAFVFGGNQPSSFQPGGADAGSNLQQILTPTNTPTSRLIKKPTRRLKK